MRTLQIASTTVVYTFPYTDQDSEAKAKHKAAEIVATMLQRGAENVTIDNVDNVVKVTGRAPGVVLL